MDITIQIREKWADSKFAKQFRTLLTELSEKYGHQFDEVLAMIDGFTGSAISAYWKSESELGIFKKSY